MNFWRTMVGLAVVGVVTQAALGAVVFQDDDADWSVDSALLGNPAWTTVLNNSDPDVWGSGTSAVEFSGPATQGQAGPFDDHIYEGGAGSELTGDLSAAGVYGALFNFYNDSATYQPAELSMYFSDGTYEWYADLALPSQGWQSYVVYMVWGDGSMWYDVSGLGGNEGNFNSSLTSVTELGIRILYDNTIAVPQQYGIDNFQLHDSQILSASTPEPGTFILLSTVLMSLGFTFGRKKREAVA